MMTYANRQDGEALGLLSVGQALAILQMGRTAFYQRLNTGEIIAKKLGRRTLVEKAEVLRFMSSLPNYGHATSLASNAVTQKPS